MKEDFLRRANRLASIASRFKELAKAATHSSAVLAISWDEDVFHFHERNILIDVDDNFRNELMHLLNKYYTKYKTEFDNL